jgi:hypothetical protein
VVVLFRIRSRGLLLSKHNISLRSRPEIRDLGDCGTEGHGDQGGEDRVSVGESCVAKVTICLPPF